jgi:DNA-binding transcriptional MerR regulator
MRIAELSRRSGVAIPTIKYYLRERLLAPGELTSPNQARYADTHLQRLRLIRALIDVGHLSIAATRDVLASVDAPGGTLHERLGQVQYAVTPVLQVDADARSLEIAAREAEALARRRGWHLKKESPAWALLIQVLAALYSLGQDDLAALLDDYADAAEKLAEVEVRCVLGRENEESILEGVVIGTTLGDTILAAVRRLAEADVSSRLTPKAAHVRAAPQRAT